MRLNLDVRRCWECPACGRQVKREGEISSLRCRCQDPPVWMRLVESQRQVREYQPFIVPEIQADELMGEEEVSAPADISKTKEAAVVVEPIEPVENEVPAAEEVPAPEVAPIDEPPEVGLPAPEPVEDSTSEAPEEAKLSPEQPAGRKGRSRRRRSSRKRSRRRGSQKGGGGE